MIIRQEIKERALTQLRLGWTYPVLATLVITLLNGLSSAPSIGLIISVLLVLPLNYGFSIALLQLIRQDDTEVLRNMTNMARSNYGRALAVPLLTSIFTFLWSLLLIVPGIIKSYAYAMANYISLDHPEYTPNNCIDYSQDMMDGHKMELFLLDLSFIGWILLGILSFGIGMLWVTPYLQTSHAVFYEKIKEEFENDIPLIKA